MGGGEWGKTGIKPDPIPALGYTGSFFLHLCESEEAAKAQGSEEEEIAGRLGAWQAGTGRGGPGGEVTFLWAETTPHLAETLGDLMIGIRAMETGEREVGTSDLGMGQEEVVVETDFITILEEGVDMRREELLDLEVLVEIKEDLNIRLEERGDLK